jgi:acyl carrier protein
MNETNIKTRVIKIISDQLNIDRDKVKESSSFIKDLGADSLDTVELIMAFEEEFKEELGGIEISEQEAEKLKTVGNLIKYILDKRKNN